MKSPVGFVPRPAYLDDKGAASCVLPAEVSGRYITGCTDGPVQSARVTCPPGHHFNGPVEYLTVAEPPVMAAVSISQPMPPVYWGQRLSPKHGRRRGCEGIQRGLW
jgi:hypothetical protein